MEGVGKDHPLNRIKKKRAEPSLAEKNAADWNRPGGGYDQWKKGDAEREKRLPVGGMEPLEEKQFEEKKPLKEALKPSWMSK